MKNDNEIVCPVCKKRSYMYYDEEILRYRIKCRFCKNIITFGEDRNARNYKIYHKYYKQISLGVFKNAN